MVKIQVVAKSAGLDEMFAKPSTDELNAGPRLLQLLYPLIMNTVTTP